MTQNLSSTNLPSTNLPSNNDASLIGVNTVLESSGYQNDPLSVYQLLCHQQQHNILLESAEIDKKHLLKSLLLTDAAVKIVCNGNTVTFSALSLNGEAAVNFAAEQLAEHAQVAIADDGKSFQATFAQVARDLDEKARLSAINPLHSLRIFNQFTDEKSHPFSVFLGGVFAFDLMAIAEDLPDVANGDNTCPDFVYYLAETLVIIDHELQSTEIIGNTFSFKDEKKAIQSQLAIDKRVAQIKEILASSVDAKQVSKFSPSFSDIDEQVKLNEELQVDISDERYCQIVEQLKENIRGVIFFKWCHHAHLPYPVTTQLPLIKH